MNIGVRLQTIADMVPAGARLVDVGTDHAYLPCALVQAGRVKLAIASDVAAGPCEAARRTLGEAGLATQVPVRLGSGLTTVTPGEVDTAVLAGMGSGTMLLILDEAPQVVKRLHTLLLQPMTGAPQLRDWAAANDWRIADERLCQEAGRLYVVLRLERGKQQPMTLLEREIGPCLLAGHDTLLRDFMAETRERLQRLTQRMAQSDAARQTSRYAEAVALLAALEEYEHETNR